MYEDNLDIQIAVEMETPDVVIEIEEETPEIEIMVSAVTGTLFPVGSLYATESASKNPATVLGVGTWTLIPPANTVNQLKSQSENFVTTGSIYIWRRTA